MTYPLRCMRDILLIQHSTFHPCFGLTKEKGKHPHKSHRQKGVYCLSILPYTSIVGLCLLVLRPFVSRRVLSECHKSPQESRRTGKLTKTRSVCSLTDRGGLRGCRLVGIQSACHPFDIKKRFCHLIEINPRGDQCPKQRNRPRHNKPRFKMEALVCLCYASSPCCLRLYASLCFQLLSTGGHCTGLVGCPFCGRSTPKGVANVSCSG